MSKVISVFERVEKKYRLDTQQFEALQAALHGRLAQDQYGLHTICNLYLDTDDYALIRESIEKPLYKEKIRLRSYGTVRAGDTVFLELKKKFKGVVYKRRQAMGLDEAKAYLRHGRMIDNETQIMREIDYFQARHGRPVPKAFIAYDRVALSGEQDPGLRVTFDQNIRYRGTHLDLAQGSWGEAVLDADQVLMEIKIPGAMPLWLARTLAELDIAPTSFSKYGACYKQLIMQHEGGLAHVS